MTNTKFFPFVLITILFINTSCDKKRDLGPTVNVKTLKETSFITTLEEKVDGSHNFLYSPTFLFAWSEIRNTLNSPITIEKKYKQLNQINLSHFYQNSLSAHEFEKSVNINAEEGIITAKAAFKKSLPFKYPLKKVDTPLIFKGAKVQSFGVKGFDRHLLNEVKILHYISKDDFIIKLLPQEEADEIIIYKMPYLKHSTLLSLLNTTYQKIDNGTKELRAEKAVWKYFFNEEDVLQIPTIKFNLETEFEPLIKNQFWVKKRKFTIEKAKQKIAFILDEKGAEVESSAELEVVTEEMEKPHPKKMIVDDTFLLIAKKTNTRNPYLVLLINNSELLIKE